MQLHMASKMPTKRGRSSGLCGFAVIIGHGLLVGNAYLLTDFNAIDVGDAVVSCQFIDGDAIVEAIR